MLYWGVFTQVSGILHSGNDNQDTIISPTTSLQPGTGRRFQLSAPRPVMSQGHCVCMSKGISASERWKPSTKLSYPCGMVKHHSWCWGPKKIESNVINHPHGWLQSQKFLVSHWGWWILLLSKPWLKFMGNLWEMMIHQGMESPHVQTHPQEVAASPCTKRRADKLHSRHWWRLASQIAVAICTVWATWSSGNQTWQWQILRFSRYLKEIIS